MPHVDTYRNGKKLASVTEIQSVIAKPFLDRWRISLCDCPAHKKKGGTEGLCGYAYGEKIRDEAGGLGQRIHATVEAFFKGESAPTNSEYEAELTKTAIAQYKVRGAVPKVLLPEQTLISDEMCLAGSPDHIIELNDDEGKRLVCIGDLKVKNQIDSLTPLQGCGYRALIKKLKGVTIDWMFILRLEKDEKKKKRFEEKFFYLPDYEEYWRASVSLWNMLNPNRKVNLDA